MSISVQLDCPLTVLLASHGTRHWNALLLDEACRHLLEEISLPGSALGGKVEFKRTLMISFFFKFYLEVLQELRRKLKLTSESAVSAVEDSDDRPHVWSWAHSSEA